MQAICIGGSVTLSANGCTGGATVKWTGGLTGSPITITPNSTQNFRASCLGINGCASDSSTVLNIVVLPKTKPIITGPAFVCGPSAITLNATGCSGANETVMWRDQSTGLTFTDNISQTKTFRAVCIRNGYCVSDSSDIFTVQFRNKPGQPTITPVGNTIVCQPASVTLSASACTGGTLGWTGGLIGSSITISSVGTKSFKVACTINGCTSDSSAVQSITIHPKPNTPTISSAGNIVCQPQSVTLTASACLGGTLGWTGGLSGQSITISTVGTKSFKVACTINSCTSDSSLVNTIQIKAKPSQPTITPPSNATVCQGNSITLTASACTGGTLSWTSGLTGSSITISSVGTKSFKVACTINGCTSDSSAVQSITIHPKPNTPTISSSGNIVCQPQTVTLTASACIGGTLGWTGGLTGQSIIISAVGTKSFKVACTINSCTSDSSLVNTIQIKAKPSQPTITPPSNATVCQGNSITLTASACTGGNLSWTSGLTGSSITISSVGTKSFKVACTINGCTSDSSAVQSITINPLPIFTISADKPEICEGESATLTVSGCIGIIAWSNNAGNVASITVSPTITTNYTATCTVNGCSGSQTSTITALQTPKVTASGPLVCDQSITLTASNFPAGASIQWRKDGVEISGATNTTLVVNEAGNYDFVVGKIVSNGLIVENNENSISKIKYLTTKLCFLATSNQIRKSIDGGLSWTVVYTINNTNGNINRINDLFFIDNLNGWVAGLDYILRTTDGGSSWTKIPTPDTFFKIKFRNNLIGVAASFSNLIFYTNNGGINWTMASNAQNLGIYGFQDLEFIPNTNTVFAGGVGGTIKSTNDGISWSLNNSQIETRIFNFINSNVGYASTYNGGLYKTIDSGLNWNLVNNSGVNIFNNSYQIKFITENIGYYINFSNSTIYKTKNGGVNWELFENTNNSNFDGTYHFWMDFISEDNGGYIFKKTMGNLNETNFRKISTPQCPTTPAIIAPPTNQASAITLLADKPEICAGESATITSSACNGTLSWSNGVGNVSSIVVAPTITTTYTATCTSGACTKTAQITITPLQTPKVTASGPLVCGQSITLTAEQFNQYSSGLQWRKDGVNIPGATNSHISVSEPGNYDFIVGVASSPTLSLVFGTGTSKVKFINSNLGFFYSGTLIKKSIDGGITWSDYDTRILLQDIYFNDANNGWAVGYAGILKTIDGGVNWSLFNNNIGATQFTKIAFKNNLVGIAVTNFNLIYLTSDGGNTWVTNNIPMVPNQTINDIKFIPNTNSVIFTATHNFDGTGFIFKSIDNGVNWTNTIDKGKVYAIHFQDSNNGWIGSTNSVYKTTNGGNSWTLFNINSDQSRGVNSIDFINPNIGYAFLSNSTNSSIIFKTINGGNTWNIFRSLNNDDYIINTLNEGLDFISEDNGWYTYSGGYHTILNQNPNKIILNKISNTKCPTTPAIVSPIPRPAGPLVINTFKSGPWTDASTWSCGFIPSSLDEVIINAGHTVTDTGNTLNAKKLKFNGNGTLQLAPTTNLRLNN